MMGSDKPDATWLFHKRDLSSPHHVKFPKGQHSESWWTALFSLFLLHENVSKMYPEIPLRRPQGGESDQTYPQVGALDYKGLTFSSFLTERQLNEGVAKSFFHIRTWPLEFKGLAVDLAIMLSADRGVVLIENKTVGTGDGSLHAYAEVVQYLNDNERKAELHVLVSRGHPNPKIWAAIEKYKLRIILWEDVLRLMAQNKFFSEVFDTDGTKLADYCDFADP
jgi:hypothetical protein